MSEAEAIGPSTLTITVENADGETATIQDGEYFVNAGPFNGIWEGQISQQSTCGDDATWAETITILHTGENGVAIYFTQNDYFNGEFSDGVISGSTHRTETESGIPILVTEWEATLVGSDVLEGSATFTSEATSSADCSGSFSFSFTRQ